MNKPLKKGGKGECQLLRGHQFKMVSGQGKWQEWMPKLERPQLDLRKPCYPQHASVPESEEHGSKSHPGNVGPDELGGPRFVADFPNLQNHKTLGKTGAGSLSVTARAVRCVP